MGEGPAAYLSPLASVDWLEIFGAVTGFLCVWLVARQNLWNWPLGITNNLLYLVVFWRARLYADASLQVVFAMLGAYGWYQWMRVPTPGLKLPVRRTSATEWAGLALFVAAAQAAVYAWLSRRTDSPVPFWDAAILTLSLAATYGQARKRLECWHLWIAVDIISVPLYFSRGLRPTAALYFLFLCICVKGLVDWRRDLLASEASSPA